MKIPIMHAMRAAEDARLLESALSGTVEEGMLAALARLHPGFVPVPTVVVNTAIMIRLRPPRFDRYKGRAIRQMLDLIQHALAPERYERIEGFLVDAVAGFWCDSPRITPRELESKLELPEGMLRKELRRQKRLCATVALGSCLETSTVIDTLLEVLTAKDMSGLGKVIVVLDAQGICSAARQLRRLPVEVCRQQPGLRVKRLSALAVPIWLHEQSHAYRGAIGGPLEDLSAQLDALRGCLETDHVIFATEPWLACDLPTPADMMERLARRQPPEYRAVLDVVERALRNPAG